MQTFPAKPINGTVLAQEIAAAAGVDPSSVSVVLAGDEIQVSGLPSDKDASAAVAAHVPPPPPPDPDVEFRAALTAATTVTQLRDALLGKAGPGAQARRPTAT